MLLEHWSTSNAAIRTFHTARCDMFPPRRGRNMLAHGASRGTGLSPRGCQPHGRGNYKAIVPTWCNAKLITSNCRPAGASNGVFAPVTHGSRRGLLSDAPTGLGHIVCPCDSPFDSATFSVVRRESLRSTPRYFPFDYAGVAAISRWSSAARPPESEATNSVVRPWQGSQELSPLHARRQTEKRRHVHGRRSRMSPCASTDVSDPLLHSRAFASIRG